MASRRKMSVRSVLITTILLGMSAFAHAAEGVYVFSKIVAVGDPMSGTSFNFAAFGCPVISDCGTAAFRGNSPPVVTGHGYLYRATGASIELLFTDRQKIGTFMIDPSFGGTGCPSINSLCEVAFSANLLSVGPGIIAGPPLHLVARNDPLNTFDVATRNQSIIDDGSVFFVKQSPYEVSNGFCINVYCPRL